MYRIVCNSLRNYASDFNNNPSDPRYRPVYFLRLIENADEYLRHKAENSREYLQLSHFLWHMRECKLSAQILHELKMLGIEGVPPDSDENVFDETKRIWQLFLKKAYWRD